MKNTIVYEWYHDESNFVKEDHKPELETHTLEKITELRKNWYVGGELYKEIEDIYYNGYWELKENE